MAPQCFGVDTFPTTHKNGWHPSAMLFSFFVHQRAKQKVRHNIEHISDADKTISPSSRHQTRAEEIITTEFISRVLPQVCCPSHVTSNYKQIYSAVHLSRKHIYIRIRTTTSLRNFQAIKTNANTLQFNGEIKRIL
jgi:hypothetical protein